jgi:UPF0755 protein
MRKPVLGLGILAAIVAGLGLLWLAVPWNSASNIDQETPYVVQSGSTLTSVARDLEEKGHIGSADALLLRAKIFGGGDNIKAGEFLLPAGASMAEIVDTLETGEAVRRFVTIPEGMPSLLVWERLMAENLLTGEIPVPEEGSVLPATYDFERGEERAKVLARMQAEMRNYLAEAWPKRKDTMAVKTLQEAVVLASIVEKETGTPEERRLVAGLYSNRLRDGMLLQADPTIIYPITKGKPLGRRIRQSEIAAVNDYNTYTMTGLPKGPITNPGRESIAAVLDPADTNARFMVADGTGGHAFAETLDEHNANVEKWFAIRRERGEM